MTTGELIRLLSHWCPDTEISIYGPSGESYIEDLLERHEIYNDNGDELNAEIALTYTEG